MNDADNSDPTMLRHKAEELLIHKFGKSDSQHSDPEIIHLIQELEVQRIEFEMQQKELLLAKQQLATIATQKYNELYDFVTVALFTVSIKGKIIDTNQCGLQMIDKDRDQIKNSQFDTYITDDTLTVFKLFLDTIFSNKNKATCEVSIVAKDNLLVNVLLNGIVMEHDDECLITAVDITPRKQVEAVLSENGEKYRYMFDNNPQPMFIYDLSTLAFLEVNQAALVHYGFSREEFLSLTLKDIHCSEDIPLLLKDIELAKNEYNPGGAWRNIKKNGDIVFVEIVSHSVISNGRQARHVLLNDITERKKTEDRLHKSKLQFDRLVTKIPVGVYILHSKPNGTIKLDFVSSRAAEIFNLSIENLLLDATLIPQSIHPEDKCEFEKLNQEGIYLKRPFDWKGRILMNGEIKWLHIMSSPELQEDGDILWHGLVIDISEDVKAEAEIIFKNEELQKIVAEKDKFFSIISHDLRSPFNSFLGLTQIMADELPSLTMEEIQKYAVTMRNSAANLMRLLENFLEWARIQQGLIPFNPLTFQLISIVNESIEMIHDAASKKGIRIVYDIPYELEVYADNNMLQTIIRNIVSNAVKFTPNAGRISIAAKKVNNDSIEISVRDTGIGMNQEMLKSLFCIDICSSRKGTEGESSTGLGLIICKDFAEKHLGKLQVESEVNKGSTFCLTLPCKVHPVLKEHAPNFVSDEEAEERMLNMKILIAEDDEISGMLITMVVKRFCKAVLNAKTGLQAIEMCRSNPDIDLVLMDLQMPEMDGYEAMKKILEMKPEMYIIAQTAFAFSEDKEKALQSGCNDFITKPIKEDNLKQKILNLLKTR